MSLDEPDRPRPIPARPGHDAKPTPVRQAMEVEDESPERSPDPDPSEIEIEVDGELWSVRVQGRTVTGGSTPLLLLGFTQAGSGDRDVREGWAVGRALSELPIATVEATLRHSGAPREPGKRPFFDDGGRRGPRDG